MDTILILATRERVSWLWRFAKAYEITRATAKVIVGLDEDDPLLANYKDLDLPRNFYRMVVEPHGAGACPVQNAIFDKFPDADVYGIMADDLIPVSMHWDKKLADAAGKRYLAYGPDGMHDERFATHPFLGGDLVRDFGFIAPAGLKHLYVDDFWWDRADDRIYVPDARLEHHHWANGKAEKDGVYRHDANHDEKVYRSLGHAI